MPSAFGGYDPTLVVRPTDGPDLSAMLASLSAYYPEADSEEALDLNIVRADRWAAWLKQLNGGGTDRPVAGLRGSSATSTGDLEGTTKVRPGEGFFQVGERIYGPNDKWKDLAMNAIAAINGGIDRRLEPDDVLNLP